MERSDISVSTSSATWITKHIYLDQQFYVNQLSPLTLPNARATGRGLDSPANSNEITCFRSLVSAIAWAGITYAPCQAGASLYQHFLPVPSLRECHGLNALLSQLQTNYVPLIIRADFKAERIIVVSDASLANAARYSQNAFVILLAEAHQGGVCRRMTMLTARSSKSKRVATSTMHSEILAMTAGVEEALYLQGWMQEISQPSLCSWGLLNSSSKSAGVIPIILVTDCRDVQSTLVRPATTTPTNRALALYISALRELQEVGRVEAFVWCSTHDCIADSLTKLSEAGELPVQLLTEAQRRSYWEPLLPYLWNEVMATPPVVPQPPILRMPVVMLPAAKPVTVPTAGIFQDANYP